MTCYYLIISIESPILLVFSLIQHRQRPSQPFVKRSTPIFIPIKLEEPSTEATLFGHRQRTQDEVRGVHPQVRPAEHTEFLPSEESPFQTKPTASSAPKRPLDIVKADAHPNTKKAKLQHFKLQLLAEPTYAPARDLVSGTQKTKAKRPRKAKAKNRTIERIAQYHALMKRPGRTWSRQIQSTATAFAPTACTASAQAHGKRARPTDDQQAAATATTAKKPRFQAKAPLHPPTERTGMRHTIR